MTSDPYAQIRGRLEKATPGPWKDFDSKCYAGDPDDGDAYVFVTDDDGCVTQICQYALDADARLIAHAPADLAFLLGDNDVLRERAEKAERSLDAIIAAYDEYRACGVLPARDAYAVLVGAINAARSPLPTPPSSGQTPK